jgi:hypothetical protein
MNTPNNHLSLNFNQPTSKLQSHQAHSVAFAFILFSPRPVENLQFGGGGFSEMDQWYDQEVVSHSSMSSQESNTIIG